jgi:hypothetical protein
MERNLASLQSTARLILAEAFDRAIELSCAPETLVVVADLRFYMWATVVECLVEGGEIG